MKRSYRIGVAAVTAVAAGALCFVSVSQAAPNTPHGPTLPAITPNISSLPPAVQEATFVALQPCRIVDTRLAGGKMATNTTRSFRARGTTGFVLQGGKSGGCGIPTSATSITVTITAVSSTGHGFVRAWPFGGPVPTATILNTSNLINLSSGAVLTLGPSSGTFAFTIGNYSSATHIVIDVGGYYAAQIEGMVSPSGSIYSGGARLVSAVHNSTGNYTVTIDTDVTYCTPTVTAYSGYVYASAYAFNGTHVQVFLWYLSAGTQTAYDGYFYLDVTC